MGPDNSLSIANTFSVTLEDIKKEVSVFVPYPITNEDELERAKKNKNYLMRMRTKITSSGKQGREASNAYNKAVLSMEKELLSPITPIEEAFALEIAEYERKQTLAIQAKKLPDRMEACRRYYIEAEPEDVIHMTDDQFHQFVIDKQAEKLNVLQGTPITTMDVPPPATELMTKVQSITPDGPVFKTTPVESREYRDWLEENEYSPTTHFLSKDGNQCILWKKVSTFNY